MRHPIQQFFDLRNMFNCGCSDDHVYYEEESTLAEAKVEALKAAREEAIAQIIRPRYEMVEVDKHSKYSSVASSYLQRDDSCSTQSTQSLSDDDLSFCDSQACIGERQHPPVSILRRKRKLGFKTERPDASCSVRFASDTKFPDPNETPQRRKPVPRIKHAGGKDNARNGHIQNQLGYLSPLLIAAAGPCLVVNVDDDGSDAEHRSSLCPAGMSHEDSERRRIERLMRRARQRQHCPTGDIRDYDDHASAAKELMALYSQGDGFYTFR